MSTKDISTMHFDTKIIHGNYNVDKMMHSMSMPICETATFGFHTVEEMDEFWEKKEYLYTREGNPTISDLENKLSLLNKAEDTVACASGMGAVCSTILSLIHKGEHILCSEGLFFHSTKFFSDFLNTIGAEISYADFKDINDVMQHIQDNTVAMFLETPANPTLGVVDIKAIATLAHENQSLCIVDSTFAPPPIQYPLDLGADLIIHSLTKYINGHGDALGGSVSGPKTLINPIRKVSLPCFTGASLSPFNAWLITRGLSTLSMRMDRHCHNALSIAQCLETLPTVDYVIYPALQSHPQHYLCVTQMNGKGSGIVSFWLKNGINNMNRREAAYKFCNALDVITVATSLGESHTLIQVENSDMIRIAVGLEDARDLVADIQQAMNSLYQ